MSKLLLQNDTALVTGAAQGIGQAIARAPEDIAPMAVAILSEKYGSYMTGTSVVIDGGIALHNWINPNA